MSSYVYEAGPAATCSSYRHRKIAGSLWQVWQAGSGQVRSLQVSDQQATNPRCHQTPRLDHAVLACASRWTWTDQDPSRDSASGSQKATLRLTNEPLGDSSPRDLVPSIRPHGRRSHLSYMTSRNALRHVLARTTPSPSAKEPPYQRVYIVFFFCSPRPDPEPCQSSTKLRWIIYL